MRRLRASSSRTPKSSTSRRSRRSPTTFARTLEEPLQQIQKLALDHGYLCPPIRTAVRTGDTLPAERRAMLKQPPHILVTTPESFFILLTAEKSRANLARVRTVIVDEIHAMADDKRGTHLVLSLERLDALVCGENRLSPGSFITGLTTVDTPAVSPAVFDVSDQRKRAGTARAAGAIARAASTPTAYSAFPAAQNPISLVADFPLAARHVTRQLRRH